MTLRKKMKQLIANSIGNLSEDALFILVQDVEYRIGSHVAGGMPDENYLKQQQDILTLVQEELNSRTFDKG